MQEIISKISAELNIDYYVVEKAIRTQFEFVKETMEQGEHNGYRAVQLQYLGKFAVKPTRLEAMQRKKNFIVENPVE